MDTEETIVLLAAAPATAYREYLYRPRGELARWIGDHYDVVARPGQRIGQALQEGDVLLQVTLGHMSGGRCTALTAGDLVFVASRPMPPGHLLLRPRRQVETPEPLPVEPAVYGGPDSEVSTIADIAGVSTVTPIQPPGRPVPAVSTAKGKSTAIAVGAYWINHYKRCNQHRTDYCNAIAVGFASAMHALGHSVAFVRGEDDASPKQWAAATDQSVNGIDTVEFAILATHSGTHGLERSGSRWLFWWLGTFDSADGCIVSTIKLDAMWAPVTPRTPVVTMNLGEGRLRYAVLDGCRSLQLGVENERDKGARAQLAESNPARTWGRCFDGVTMLFGFTGLSSDAGWTSQRGAYFGHRAGRGESLGDSWIDEAYSWWTDDVPVAMACGRSEEDARRRVNGESLKVVGQRLRSADIGGYAWIWRS